MRHRLYRWISIVPLLLLIGTSSATSQLPTLRFERITRANGLPNTEIFSLLMDRQGFLWIGSAAGLIRYDGVRFTYIPVPNDLSLAATQGVISQFIEAHDGVLWCATPVGGVLRYAPETDSITRLTTVSHGLTSNTVYAICEDGNGTLWFGGSGGLDTLDVHSYRFRHITRPSPDGPVSISVGVSSIHEFPRGSGVIWIGTYGEGLIRFDRNRGEWTLWQNRPFDPSAPANGYIQQLFMSERNNEVLWVGTPEGGLHRLHIGSGKWDRIPLSHGRDRISSPGRVNWISETSEGMLLISTLGAGLHILDPLTGSTEKLSSDQHDPTSLSHNEVTCTLIDSSGILWAGSYHGIYKANPVRSLFTSYFYSASRQQVPVGLGLREWLRVRGEIAFPSKHKYHGCASRVPGTTESRTTGQR